MKELKNAFENPRADAETRTKNIIAAVVLCASLLGLLISVIVANWLAVLLFLVSAGGISVIFYLSGNGNRKNLAAAEGSGLEWQTSLPETQRQNLSLEVFELAKILEIGPEQISDMQSAYIVAEDLALRQIQQEEEVPLMRHVSVWKAPFEAVFVKNDVVVCIEVAFLVAPDIRQEKIDAIMRRMALVSAEAERSGSGMKVRLMLVLVTQLTPEDEQQLRKVLNKTRFPETPVDIDIRFVDFESLQQIYVTETV